MADKTLEIQIKADDKASSIADKVQQKFSKIGSSVSKALGKATAATQSSRNAMKNLDNYFKVVQGSSDGMTKHAITGLTKMTNAEKQAALEIMHISENVSQGYHAWDTMSSSTLRWADHVKLAENYVKGLGYDIESTRGKITVVGTAITSQISSKLEPLRNKLTPFTNAWNNVKSRVSNVGSVIKSQLGSAIEGVKSKVKGLASSFSGLGGVISSAIGAIGMASIGDLTIGLSLSREKMSSLNTAIMGSKTASDALLGSIDTMTNDSVVGMDQMVNAMNKIKLSTQMSNEELSNTKEVVMKLGEASMLMGNDTETAAYQMGEAFSGLNGDFQILKENFGITKEKMKEMGWSGNADDVEGYTKALEGCLEGLGDLGSVMETNSGKIAQVQKKFRTAGRTLGDMLTPYIGQAADAFLNLEKQFPGVAQGLVAAAGGVSLFATVAPSLNGVFTGIQNVMDITKTAGEGIRALGSAIGIMSSAEELAGAAAAASAAGHATAAGAEGAEAAAAGAAAVSTWALVWPVLAVTAAIAGIAFVVYEVGKSFGWWTDVGSMIAAITAGVKRLWAAFINNPDVQAMIQGISDAFAWIAPRVEPATQAVLEFLGVGSGGEFDIVRIVIDAVGFAFHMMAEKIRVAVTILQTIYGVFQSIYSFLAPYGQMIYNALKPIVCILLGCSPGIVPALRTVQQVFSAVFSAIAGFIPGVVSNIVNGILNNIKKLPGKVLSYLKKVSSHVVTQGSNWVKNAKSKASSMVTGTVNYVKGLPGKAYNYLHNVVGRINTAGTSWISAAKSKASSMVSGITNSLTGAPGAVYSKLIGIKDRISSALSAAYNKAKAWMDKIRNAVSNVSIPAFAGEDRPGAYAGYDRELTTATDLLTNTTFNTVTGETVASESESLEIEIHHTLDFLFDFKNVPEQLTNEELKSLIKEVLNDKSVIDKLVNNPEFQALDQKVKSRIISKAKRARGV